MNSFEEIGKHIGENAEVTLVSGNTRTGMIYDYLVAEVYDQEEDSFVLETQTTTFEISKSEVRSIKLIN